MVDLNVGLGVHAQIQATPMVFDCFTVDVLRCAGVDLVCDVQHLPFRAGVFRDVYCFHVLEHTVNPAKALSELVRVAQRLVEVEVPHRFGRMAKSEGYKKGNVGLYHVCSFGCMWFHKCLKNFVYCLRVLSEFPREFYIHVWVYVEETRKRRFYRHG